MPDLGREVIAWLKSAPKALRSEIATEIERQAQRLAQAQRAKLAELEKPPEETGGGMASIRVEPGKDGLTQVVLAGGPATTRNGYDHMLGFEFGTIHQPARSFFWSTARAMVPSMAKAIENSAGVAVGKIADDD
jgi:hypothetical protein